MSAEFIDPGIQCIRSWEQRGGARAVRHTLRWQIKPDDPEFERESRRLRLEVERVFGEAGVDTNSGRLQGTPAFADFLMTLFARPKQKDYLLGCLEENFTAALARGCSLRHARRLYWAEVMRSVGPLAWGKLKRLGVVWRPSGRRRP